MATNLVVRTMVLRFFLPTILLCLLLAGPALGQQPAVSGGNAKISAEGGLFEDEAAGLVQGSFTVPLGRDFGVQFDGVGGAVDDEFLRGGAVHLFTRNPASYLLGAYGSFHTWNSIDVWRLAAEAELYVNRFTFTGLAGYERISAPDRLNGQALINEDDGHFFTHVDLAFYPTDDLKLYAGYRYAAESHIGAAGAEYLLRGLGTPVSLFVDGRFGEDDHTQVTGGLRIYLGSSGSSKSLIQRHRTEDPQSYLPAFPEPRRLPSAAPDTDDETDDETAVSVE